MADKGWIKTYRKIQDCWIWLDKEPFDKRSAWIDLLLTANHADKKILFNGELITIERGQILTSIRKLADKWKWSYDKVLRFLRLIESDGMIKKESDNFRTLITIENYELYQDVPNTDQTPISEQSIEQSIKQSSEQSSERISDKQELKNDKNVKNLKNDKNNIPPISPKGESDGDTPKKKNAEVYYPNDELLDCAFKEFLSMRKSIKKPLATKQALTRMINKIEKLSNGDNDLAIKILNQSTDHCWQDVYPLKEDNYGGGNKKSILDRLSEV